MTPDKTTELIYGILKNDVQLALQLSGSIFRRHIPEDMQHKENISISCLTYQHGNPATAVSNVNIHVPYRPRRIGGREQMLPDTERLSVLAPLVTDALKGANIPACSLYLGTESTIEQDSVSVRNIRVNWMIAEHE